MPLRHQMRGVVPMAKNILRTGKKVRPKTAVKGKRYRCAKCRKRSPKPVKTPAPWYCPKCLPAEPDSLSWRQDSDLAVKRGNTARSESCRHELPSKPERVREGE